MRSLDWYLDTARARVGAPSDAELSRRLELERNTVQQYRSGRAFPSEDVTLRLAALCDVNPEEALCELAIWRAEAAQRPERAAIYKRLLARATICALAALAIVGTGHETKTERLRMASGETIHYAIRRLIAALRDRGAAHAH